MTAPEILMIGVGLSMDAVAVSMTNGMVYKRLSNLKWLAIPIFFGFFQGFMPFAGFLTGGLLAEVISKYAGIVIFVILGVIGAKMVTGGISDRRGDSEDPNKRMPVSLGWAALFFQAIATSIDAFAVGIGFSAANVNILPAAALIAATTAVLSGIALLIGRNSGDVLGGRAEIFGGIILIVIGIKAVL